MCGQLWYQQAKIFMASGLIGSHRFQKFCISQSSGIDNLEKEILLSYRLVFYDHSLNGKTIAWHVRLYTHFLHSENSLVWTIKCLVVIQPTQTFIESTKLVLLLQQNFWSANQNRIHSYGSSRLICISWYTDFGMIRNEFLSKTIRRDNIILMIDLADGNLALRAGSAIS